MENMGNLHNLTDKCLIFIQDVMQPQLVMALKGRPIPISVPIPRDISIIVLSTLCILIDFPIHSHTISMG